VPESTTPGESLLTTVKRQSIQPTYDHRETGDRYTIETRVDDRPVSLTGMPDPFATHRVTLGWHDLLRGLLRRRLVVTVIVSGDSEIIEDVCELNADYAGRYDSTRRAEWREQIEGALRRV